MPLSRSQFCVLLEELEVLGNAVEEELLGEDEDVLESVLLPETLLEELLGEVLEPEVLLGDVTVLLELLELGIELDPVLELPLALSRMHWSFWVPVRSSQFCEVLPETLLDEVLGEELLGEEMLGVALVLPEPTLEPDDPMLPLLDDCANAAAEIASSAALTAALSTFKFMVAPSKVGITAAADEQAMCRDARRAV